MVQYLHFRILQFPFTEWWLTITKVITRTYDWWDDLRLPGHPSWNGDLNRSGTLHSGTRARELKHRQEDHRTTDGAETSLHEGIGNVARSCFLPSGAQEEMGNESSTGGSAGHAVSCSCIEWLNPTPKVRGQKGRLQLFLLPCMFFACEKMLFEICICNIWVVNLTSSHLCPRGLALSRAFYRSSFGTLISSPSWCWAHTWCSTSNGTFFAATRDLHAYTHRIHVWYIC